MSLSDRILVMCEGELIGEVAGKDADERTLGCMMAGTTVEGSDQRSPQAAAINDQQSGVNAPAVKNKLHTEVGG